MRTGMAMRSRSLENMTQYPNSWPALSSSAPRAAPFTNTPRIPSSPAASRSTTPWNRGPWNIQRWS
jgi:hypothetical protein